MSKKIITNDKTIVGDTREQEEPPLIKQLNEISSKLFARRKEAAEILDNASEVMKELEFKNKIWKPELTALTDYIVDLVNLVETITIESACMEKKAIEVIQDVITKAKSKDDKKIII